MLHNLLLYRLIIFNLMGAVLLGWATYLGLTQMALAADSTGIVYVMILLFIGGLASIFVRATKVTNLINGVKRGLKFDINRSKFLERSGHIDDIAGWLVTLGLLGTVIGMVMALEKIDPATLSNAEGAKTAVVSLIQGMRIAFYTTIVGAILGLWTEINRRVLKTATVVMLEDVK